MTDRPPRTRGRQPKPAGTLARSLRQEPHTAGVTMGHTRSTSRSARLAAVAIAACVAVTTLTIGVAAPAKAAPKPGAKCAKVGKVTSNGLICKRKNGKKVFVRLPAPAASTPASTGTTTGGSTGGTTTAPAPTSPEFTAAEKETIKQSFAQALTGKQLDRTFTDNGSLTQLIWHMCPNNRYGLLSNLTFSGSGSTTSTEIGTWTIAEAGGIRNVAEGVLIQMRPDDPSIQPYSLEVVAFADGRLEVNGRRAVASPSGEC